MIVTFGEDWRAPALYDEALRDRPARRHPTPVGVPCAGCRCTVEAQDRGYIKLVLHPGPDDLIWSLEPVHRECDLRMQLAEDAHGRSCGCGGRPGEAGFLAPEQIRAQALEVWARYGGPTGRGPCLPH